MDKVLIFQGFLSLKQHSENCNEKIYGSTLIGSEMMVLIWVVIHIALISRYILTKDHKTYNRNVEVLHPYQKSKPFPIYLFGLGIFDWSRTADFTKVRPASYEGSLYNHTWTRQFRIIPDLSTLIIIIS